MPKENRLRLGRCHLRASRRWRPAAKEVGHKMRQISDVDCLFYVAIHIGLWQTLRSFATPEEVSNQCSQVSDVDKIIHIGVDVPANRRDAAMNLKFRHERIIILTGNCVERSGCGWKVLCACLPGDICMVVVVNGDSVAPFLKPTSQEGTVPEAPSKAAQLGNEHVSIGAQPVCPERHCESGSLAMPWCP